jgi:hypothetical protein
VHLEKLQAEKEESALQKIVALMPQMGAPVLVASLKESSFDVEQAVALLRKFGTEHEEELEALHKVIIKLNVLCILERMSPWGRRSKPELHHRP